MSDYVIVGAGSAGCVLANRLTEDPAVRVTLLEAGGADRNLLYRMPAGFLELMRNGWGNWKYESVPQPGLGGRTMYFPRGKVLGGSSAINGLVAIRGTHGDYDRWAQAGNRGWSYEDCLPYFKKLEKFEEGDTEYRGHDGPIGVTRSPDFASMNPISRAFLDACQQAGYPYNPDVNAASQEGVGPTQANFYNARRQSASHSYLEPAMERPNLEVVTGAMVKRILLRDGRAAGIEYMHDGKVEQVMADREVLICGGAINSPQLLQLSGIGDGEHLQSIGVETLHHLPGVGRNLQDHIGLTLKQRLTKPYSTLSQLKPWNMAKALAQYLLFKSGPTVGNGLEAWAFLKSREGLEEPDIQYYCVLLMYGDHGRDIIREQGFMFYFDNSRPHSRGTVLASNADPLSPPAIDPNYFDHPEDVAVLRRAIRIGREIIAQPAFDDMRGEEYGPGANRVSDEDLDAYIRAEAMSLYHPVGTCRMGSDDLAVVDDQLRVRGVSRLRVIDASIMPSVISGNTNFPTMMIAEKAADMIKVSSSL